MTVKDLISLSPFIIIAFASVMGMLVIAYRRDHNVIALLSLAGFSAAAAVLPGISSLPPHRITPLLIVDSYSLFYSGLIFAAGIVVVLISHGYLKKRDVRREEFYILLLVATLGSAVLVASSHFASLFLGLEILNVSLYALLAYLRESERAVEAGVKYLILAAVSASFMLFGMALVYGELGTMDFAEIPARAAAGSTSLLLAGFVLITIGIGFKLGVVPFHLWTPDVYEGAPAPVTAFVATVSKGAVFALLLRYFTKTDMHSYSALPVIFTVISIASMFAGNLLALFQENVKRILAYSSIAHLGYLLVAFLATGPLALQAVTYYLVAYFITTLGAFGVITLVSGGGRDADGLDDYRGLAMRRPLITAVFTAMLLSLAGIPLTAGFLGKFYVVAAGAGSALWLLIIMLLINSAIGLFYYLRIIVAMYERPERETRRIRVPALPLAGSIALAILTLTLIWFGVYPAPLIEVIRKLTLR